MFENILCTRVEDKIIKNKENGENTYFVKADLVQMENGIPNLDNQKSLWVMVEDFKTYKPVNEALIVPVKSNYYVVSINFAGKVIAIEKQN